MTADSFDILMNYKNRAHPFDVELNASSSAASASYSLLFNIFHVMWSSELKSKQSTLDTGQIQYTFVFYLSVSSILNVSLCRQWSVLFLVVTTFCHAPSMLLQYLKKIWTVYQCIEQDRTGQHTGRDRIGCFCLPVQRKQRHIHAFLLIFNI